MKLYESIPDDLAHWAQRQPVFFTGSAPTHGAHVNVSPKGLSDSHFAILGPNKCAYIDRTGSGCETIAHAYENGRLCLMFNSFGPAPRILRFFCHSSVVEYDQPGFSGLVHQVSKGQREAFDGARAVVVCDVWQVQTSCGYGVPRVKRGIYASEAEDQQPYRALLAEGSPDGELSELAVFEARPTLDTWAKKKADTAELQAYQDINNSRSIDGLPGLRVARRNLGESVWVGDTKAHISRIFAEKEAVAAGFLLAFILYFIWTGIDLALFSAHAK